jgi:hypothetical protein
MVPASERMSNGRPHNLTDVTMYHMKRGGMKRVCVEAPAVGYP